VLAVDPLFLLYINVLEENPLSAGKKNCFVCMYTYFIVAMAT